MERFLERHQGRIVGILSDFDRMLFRGTLRSICRRRRTGSHTSDEERTQLVW
jgi:hypothetical protein